MNKISAVLPIAVWDFERSKILFRSLNKYFDSESIEIIYIAFPEKEKMQKMLQALGFKFNYKIIHENDIIPNRDHRIFKRTRGWLRQQIVKMYISKFLNTQFYICMDSDIICKKPTKYDDLIVEGKPKVNMEPKSLHKVWWKDAIKVLKIDNPITTEGMSSSTNIFITEEVLALIDYIEKIYKKSFIMTLCNWIWTKSRVFNVRWTEYKLYWSFIEYRNKVNDYKTNDVVWGESIWKCTEYVNEELFKSILTSTEGYFTICQSTRLKNEDVLNHAIKYLDI